MRFVAVWLSVIFIVESANGQSKVTDSLANRLEQIDMAQKERKKSLITLAYYLAMDELPNKAIEKLDEASKIEFEGDSLTSLLFQEYTRSYYLKGDFVKALGFADELEKYADIERNRTIAEAEFGVPKSSKTLNIADAYSIIGEIYRKIGDYPNALKYAMESNKIAELLGKQALLANSYNNIGILYQKQEDLEQSKEFYLRALALNQKMDRQFYIGSNYNNLGTVYRSTAQYDSAFYVYQQALSYIKSPYGLATIYGNIGSVFYDQEIYDSAEYYHSKALVIQKDNGFKEQMSLSLINLSEVMTKTNRFEEGVMLGLQAYEVNQQENNYHLLSSSAHALADVYEQKGDLTNGLFYFKKYQQYNDSVYNQNKRQEILNLQFQFQTKENEKERQLLLEKSLLDEAEIRFQTAIGIVLAIILLLLLWIIYLIVKRNKVRRALNAERLKNEQAEKQYLKKELNYKNQELINFALQIVERNDFLSEVNKEIEKWVRNGLGDNPKVKQLSQRLRANATINKQRKEFDSHVNSVYESFYNKLRENYPELTLKEQRLAALLRLNLSSKEISSITAISPKSVDMSRYRLRTKLALDNEENLIDFLNRI